MSALGSDTGELRDLADLFDRTGVELSRSTTTIERALASTIWMGADSARFRSGWGRHRATLHDTSEQLDRLAADLREQSAQQERASAASLDDHRGRSTAGSDPAESDIPRWGDPLPKRSEFWVLTGGAAAAYGVDGEVRIGRLEFKGGTSAFVLERTFEGSISGGLSAGVGGEGADDKSYGAALGADGKVAVAITSRRVWTGSTDDRVALVMEASAGELWENLKAGPGPIGFVTGWSPITPFAEAAASATGLKDRIPTPDVRDKLVGFGLTASAAAELGLPIATGSGELEQRIGIRDRAGTPSLLIETEGRYAAGVGGSPSSSTVKLELEIPRPEGDTQPVITTRTTISDGQESIDRTVATFDRDELNETVDRAMKAFRAGRFDQAAEEASSIFQAVDPEQSWQDAVAGKVDSDLYDVDISAALGPKVSGSLGGGRRVVEFSDP